MSTFKVMFLQVSFINKVLSLGTAYDQVVDSNIQVVKKEIKLLEVNTSPDQTEEE